VLVIVGNEESVPQAVAAIREALKGQMQPELKVCRFESKGASEFFDAMQVL
jgi:hypothetical protein